jgi:hypothetical protein
MSTIIKGIDWDKERITMPSQMRAAKRWLVYKMVQRPGGKPDKVPYYTNGKPRNGTLDSPEDVRQLATYQEAANIVENNDVYSGLGFALGQDGEGYWQGIDVDAYQENNLEALVKQLPGYVERSPSRAGVHAIGYGEFFNGRNEGNGVEYYSSGRYFTYTGDVIRSDGLRDLKEFIKAKINPQLRDRLPSDKVERGYLIQSPEQLEEIRNALTYINPDCDYQKWKQVLFSLHRIEGGVEMWAQWSITAKEPKNRSTYDTRVKEGHTSLMTYRGEVNIGTLFMYAMENGYKPNSAAETIMNTKEPVSTADYEKLFAFVDVNYEHLIEPDWVVDGFIGEGVTMIAGATGRGKSSTIVPLTLNIAHLTEENFLTPRHRRKVIYLTEDSNQVQRLIFGMKKHHSREFNFPDEEWNEWFKIINTHRMSATAIQYLAELCTEHMNTIDGKEIPPLVVFDTASASFNIDEENNNSEAAKAVSIVKTEFWVKRFIPVWIAGHTSKANNREQMIEHMSARGANAWEADVNGTAYIFEDENVDGRIMATGKRRFDPVTTEIRTILHKHRAVAINRYGERNENANYYTAEFLESSSEERKELREESNAQTANNEIAQTLFHIDTGQHPITKEMIKKEVKMGSQKFKSSFENLERTGTIESYFINDVQERKRLGLNNRQQIFYRLRKNWIPS